MQRYNSFHSINVFRLETERWEYAVHRHNFYELIFVEKGSGTHILNGVSYPFKQNEVLLLTPNDAHEFIIEKEIKFIFLKFTEQVFLEKLGTKSKTYWEASLQNVLTNADCTDASIECSEQDCKHLLALLSIILYEYTNKALYNNEVVLELFGAIMSIVTRNLNQKKASVKHYDKDTEKLNAILTYIRINAVHSDKMTIVVIAAAFNLSPNYISIFVKKHSGLSIQQHIIQAKVKLAEKLLKQKRFSVNEIADRLSFNDASHFNKIFKKYRGVSPSGFMG